RRILDRLVGYKLSPLLWNKVKRGLSAGRVQSVALRLICDREDEIKAFTPEEYWSITAQLEAAGGKHFEAKLRRFAGEAVELKDESEAKRVVNELKEERFEIASVQRRERRRNPAPPFTTST